MICKELQQCIIFILSCQMERMARMAHYGRICEKILAERIEVEAREDNLEIITLNWDTLFERKLMETCEAWNTLHEDRKVAPDLCFYDYTFEENEQRIPSTIVKTNGYYNIKLLKLHGTLNWLVCPKCGRVYVDYKRNIALKELGTLEKEELYCRICTKEMGDGESPQLESLIITPTSFKELDNLHL